ncbi:hypothetical protein [Herpetosiphon gulosus]|uniref:Uncharacterized protein n=1 Tax=Herpetosiphon gulosus TaxID=1973496 RepID=A0ABP9X769_9CHLR
MSSFTYLIPLDWDTFTQDLLPAWKYLLDTPSSLPTFVYAYLPPDHDERFLVDWDRALWASFPPGYCDALGWNPTHPILTTAAVRLHGESTRAARIPAMYPASEVLGAAIAQYARLDGGQPDPLRHRMHPFMCHPLDYPDLQAVGDNQGLRDVLALVFEPRYHRAGYTSYRPHAAASRRLIDATAQLMLGMRTLPGLLMPPQPLSQPGWA